MLRLVIPVDGSDASLRAIDAALRFTKEAGVEVLLVHVREAFSTYHGELSPREYERIGEHERDKQAQVLERALGYARHLGLEQVTALAESGLPEDEIPRVATERAADMVVMATRGLGAVGALLLGSVTQRVVRNATVPVLLVK
jgi:nucleotide-binding universal stress UspA family protein